MILPKYIAIVENSQPNCDDNDAMGLLWSIDWLDSPFPRDICDDRDSPVPKHPLFIVESEYSLLKPESDFPDECDDDCNVP